MVHIQPEALTQLLSRILVAAGAPTESADLVAGSLVESNLVGHDSHGALRISYYVDALLGGSLDPQGPLTIVRESATTALVEGGNNFGQVVLYRAMDMAIAKARAHDLGMVAVHVCGHTGRMGEYAVRAAEQGLMGGVFGTGSRKGGTVAPYGGITPAFNTNPMSWSLPATRFPAVYFDFATSVVAWGKIQAAIDKGQPIPPGWLTDASGQPTSDPEAHRRGGAILPFGGHKGSALAFMVEAVAGGLTGMGCALLDDYASDFSTLLVAVNIEAFRPLDEFRRMVDGMVEAIKASAPAPGFDEILVPGEIEWRTRAERLRDGLQLADGTWRRIVEAGARVGVAVPESL